MSQKCPYSEDTPPCLFAAQAAGLPSFLEGGCPPHGAGSIGVGLFILPVRALPVRTCLVLRAQSAQLCFAQITRTVMLVIHDEHHSAIGEPLTEPQRRANGPPTKGWRMQAGLTPLVAFVAASK